MTKTRTIILSLLVIIVFTIIAIGVVYGLKKHHFSQSKTKIKQPIEEVIYRHYPTANKLAKRIMAGEISEIKISDYTKIEDFSFFLENVEQEVNMSRKKMLLMRGKNLVEILGEWGPIQISPTTENFFILVQQKDGKIKYSNIFIYFK